MKAVAEIEVDEAALADAVGREVAPFETALREVGQAVVDYVKSYTVELTEDGRPKHPGEWADKTGRLVGAYDFTVGRQGDRWVLVLSNRAPHAHLVEAYEGFWVLHGVEESSVFADAFRHALGRYMPNWELTIDG